MKKRKYIILRIKNVSFTFEFDCNKISYKQIAAPEIDPSTISYVAISDDQIIGVLMIAKEGYGRRAHIYSRGTIVRPAYRKLGIGAALWREMLDTERPGRVRVDVITDRGCSLIESIQESYPEIKWTVYNNGTRSRRDLRGRQ